MSNNNNSNSDTILISDALRETQAATATIAAADTSSSSSLNHHQNPNRSINGTAVEEEDDSATAENQLSADLALFLANPSLRAALADGSLDLKSYSVTVNEEVQQLEKQCIAVYRSKEQEIAELAKDAEVCQTVLRQLHEMLLGFQADLGGLSGDIRQLQEKSRMLDVQLRNRRAAEAALRHFLEHLIVSPETANAILTGPVNTTFVAAVAEVQQLYKDCSSEKPQEWSADMPVTETVAGQEMKQHLHTLRLVAVQRSREYLLQQMALLRRPQTNVRLLQVHGLLKHAALYDFLEECSPDTIATEIFHVYCESMTVTLQQLFRTYSQQLLQLDATHTHCGRADVIAMDEAVFKDRPSARLKKRVDLFCLGSRASDCFPGSSSGGGENHHHNGSPHHQPILAHVALLQKETYPYERLFCSLLGHLVDAVTNEHVFCRQFFKRDAFPQLFTGTLSLLTEQLENYLFTCYDALCLLLMIKVTHSYRRTARQRKIRSLDPFFDQITHLLWPRLKTVMEGHLRSIQQADATKLGTIDLHAHYVSRRFAEFCCSILLILHSPHHHHSEQPHPPHQQQHRRASSSPSKIGSSLASKYTGNSESNSSSSSSPTNTTSTGTAGHSNRRLSAAVTTTEDSLSSPPPPPQQQTAGDRLLQDLNEMMEAFLQLLERLSEEHSTQKKRTVFLINNLDHCLSIFQERRVTGKECTKLLEQLMIFREQFVEEELLTSFSKMIAFVQQTEAYMVVQQQQSGGRGSSNDYDINLSVVEALVLDFASNWKSAIELINREILSYFSNFRNGMEILKHCLTQLLLYYTRFQDIIRKVWKKPPPSIANDLVSTNVILAEIKKYALAI